jgi:hypothetical protein
MKGTRQKARRELVVSAAFSAAKMGYKKHTTKVSKVLAVPAATSDSLKGYENKTRESDKK